MSTPFESASTTPSTTPTPLTTPPAIHRVRLQEEAAIARLIINPPLDAAAFAELAHQLDTWKAPQHLKALALDLTACGSSAAEHTGGKGLVDSRQSRVRERALTVAQERVLAALNRIRAPILGIAAGVVPPLGCILLSSCDLLLAQEDSAFVREGATGLAYHTSLRTGATGALTERISALQAYRQGIVTWLAPTGKLTAETERILGTLVDKSAVALTLAKRAFLLGLTQAKEPDKALDQISELYLREVMSTADALEGLNAFLEKRSPRWQNQ